MLAPIDKMKSRVNDIIQIIITTACTLQCSNCTQLLPFRSDYRHMTLDCFREAVRSLKEWPGVVALFGGNPCNHPKFPEICEILAEEIPEQNRRGLWSNDLLAHGEIAKKTFFPNGRFNLNAHGVQRAADMIRRYLPGQLIHNSDKRQSTHAAMLVDWRDLNLTESDWVNAREQCDINLKWSGAIVEREGKPFAYFCEVAAAIDGIRGTNHGIAVFPGWWKLDMGAMGFQDQVKGCCDGCGVPLKQPGHLDNEEIYDVSKNWDWLVGSTKTVDVEVHGKREPIRENTDYMGVRK